MVDYCRKSPLLSVRYIFKGHEDRILRLAWSPNGDWLASPSDDTSLRIWDPKAGKELQHLEGSVHPLGSVAWSPDGKRLAAGDSNGLIHIWNVSTGEYLHAIKASAVLIRDISWKGAFLASASNDGMIKVWETNEWSQLSVYRHRDRVTSVQWASNGSLILAASDDDRILRVCPIRGSLDEARAGHANILDLARSHDDRLIASAGSEGTINIWDLYTGVFVNKLENHNSNAICSISFSGDGYLLASKSNRDHSIRIWDCATWSPKIILKTPSDSRFYLWYSSIRFHPWASTLAAVCNGDREIAIIDIDVNGITKQEFAVSINLQDLEISSRIQLAKSKIDRRSVRLAINSILRTDSDLEMYLITYYFDVISRCSSGMDRLTKIKILFQLHSSLADLETMMRNLSEYDQDARKEFEVPC